jgi:hypothetical protein
VTIIFLKKLLRILKEKKLRGVPEVENLRQLMHRPLDNGRVTWPLQWEFNQAIRVLDSSSGVKDGPWIRAAIKDLKYFLSRMMSWGQA